MMASIVSAGTVAAADLRCGAGFGVGLGACAEAATAARRSAQSARAVGVRRGPDAPSCVFVMGLKRRFSRPSPGAEFQGKTTTMLWRRTGKGKRQKDEVAQKSPLKTLILCKTDDAFKNPEI
jgi:hypothetical protein